MNHKESGPPGDMLGVRLMRALATIESLEAQLVEAHESLTIKEVQLNDRDSLIDALNQRVSELEKQNVNLLERVGGQSHIITRMVETMKKPQAG